MYAPCMSEPSQLLTVTEAAALVARDESTIRRWVRAGKLTKHVGPGRAGGGRTLTRVDRAELVAILPARTKKPFRRNSMIETCKRLFPETDWSDEALERGRQRRLNAGPEVYIKRDKATSRGRVKITLGVPRPVDFDEK